MLGCTDYRPDGRLMQRGGYTRREGALCPNDKLASAMHPDNVFKCNKITPIDLSYHYFLYMDALLEKTNKLGGTNSICKVKVGINRRGFSQHR